MKSWKEICAVSLVHFMAFPEMQSGEGDFVQSIHQLAQMDLFGALEMGTVNSASVRADVCRVAEEYGIKIGFGAQAFILSRTLNLNAPDSADRALAVRMLIDLMGQAEEMGAVNFCICSGKDPGADLRAAAYDHLADSIEQLTVAASRRGMLTTLELFDRSCDKKALVGPAPEAANLAERVRKQAPAFGLLYDMGHMPLLDETPQTALPILAPYLHAVHLGSCVKDPASLAYGDKHPRFGYPGGVNGTPELVAFLRELFNVGFLKQNAEADEVPWVGFEVRPQAGETTDQILENIRSTWQEAWAQL